MTMPLEPPQGLQLLQAMARLLNGDLKSIFVELDAFFPLSHPRFIRILTQAIYPFVGKA
jgi:hypothetical protein